MPWLGTALAARSGRGQRGDIVLTLEGFLPYRLNVLATEVSQALARAYGEKFGISIPEWRVLATLGQFGTVTARDIGQHSRMHKTTVSRAVSTLEKRHLIKREANKDDMREALLSMSDAGKAIYDQIVPMARGFSRELCDGMTESELRDFGAIVEKLLTRATAMAAWPEGQKS